MDQETYARKAEALRGKLYRTAYCYLGSEAMALDVLDEAVYKGLRGAGKLRQPEYFETWLTRILLNECSRELKRSRRFTALEDSPELTAESLDHLPLKQAILRLPKDLKDVIVLRYFGGYTLAETAEILSIPAGTVSTRQRRALELLRLDLEEVEP